MRFIAIIFSLFILIAITGCTKNDEGFEYQSIKNALSDETFVEQIYHVELTDAGFFSFL